MKRKRQVSFDDNTFMHLKVDDSTVIHNTNGEAPESPRETESQSSSEYSNNKWWEGFSFQAMARVAGRVMGTTHTTTTQSPQNTADESKFDDCSGSTSSSQESEVSQQIMFEPLRSIFGSCTAVPSVVPITMPNLGANDGEKQINSSDQPEKIVVIEVPQTAPTKKSMKAKKAPSRRRRRRRGRRRFCRKKKIILIPLMIAGFLTSLALIIVGWMMSRSSSVKIEALNINGFSTGNSAVAPIIPTTTTTLRPTIKIATFTLAPTPVPTKVPPPTRAPVSSEPTKLPIKAPTFKPTPSPNFPPTSPLSPPSPSPSPSNLPTSLPNPLPNPLPTFPPTYRPTSSPTSPPSPLPTCVPTSLPTPQPTFLPTSPTSPTSIPTKIPTSSPTFKPSKLPTFPPTIQKTPLPTYLVTDSLQRCQECTDKPHPFLSDIGEECSGHNMIETKCNKNSVWQENNYCQYSCYIAGNGYDGDFCCTPSPTYAPFPPTPHPTYEYCHPCSDIPIPYMAVFNATCDGDNSFSQNLIQTKCNLNDVWSQNRYCRATCYHAGNGYEGDICC